MAYSLSPWLKPRFFITGTNRPLAGGLMYTYKAGTTDNATTYSDDAGTPNTNPIQLDSDGQCDLFLDDAVSYRIILKNSAGVTQFDKDRIASLGSTQVQSFNSIAALRLRSGTTIANAAKTLGYYSAGDGGGNSFYWDSTSVATDNGGTVIKPTAVSGAGRWLAVKPTFVNVAQFGAKGDGITDDYAKIQAALTAAGAFGSVGFAKTSTGIYLVSQELKFYDGQNIFGYGGTSVVGAGCEIRLTALANGVMSPDTPETTKYAGTIKDIYFNAQGYGDYGLSLYNCCFLDVAHCAANSTKAGGCGLLLDSNVSLRCYFNIIRGGRFFATGTDGAAIRFTRGANANTVIGGKCGSSVKGMEFLTSSSGNNIIGTDFEDNELVHVYSDSPSNNFINTHMESRASPPSSCIGFWLTNQANNTTRIGTTYASTVTEQLRDFSKTGSVLDTRIDSVSTKGDLRFGPAKFLANYLSTITTLDYDPDLVSGTSNADFRMFLNTLTSGLCRIVLYKGNGTSDVGIILNAKTGDVQHGDLLQENGSAGGVYRKTIRRTVAPTTGSWTQGDICNFISPVSSGYIGAVCTVSGTPGTWKNYGLIT